MKIETGYNKQDYHITRLSPPLQNLLLLMSLVDKHGTISMKSHRSRMSGHARPFIMQFHLMSSASIRSSRYSQMFSLKARGTCEKQIIA